MLDITHLKNTEYTGVNRCTPCTIVNCIIAIGLSGLIGILVWSMTSGVISLFSAVAFLLVGGMLIWLRGYLIPGTPALTRRYMPQWALRWFGKTPNQSSLDNRSTETTIDPETYLLDQGIIEECEDINDVCLRSSINDDWQKQIERTPETLHPHENLELFGFDLDNLELDERGSGIVLTENGRRIGVWPSPTAFRVDMASASVLADQIPDWEQLSPADKAELLAALRIFLDECPDGGEVQIEEQTVESCCSSREVISVICSDSGERLLEQPAEA